jgi:hypothetical protein
MSRIRTIKPELLDDERVAELPHGAFRMFIACILLADDFGNLRAEPRQLYGRALVAVEGCEARDAQAFRDRLAAVGLIELYRLRGQTYAHVTNWEKHQKVDHPSKQGRVPTIDEPGVELMSIVSTTSIEPREVLGKSRETLANVPETLAIDQDQDQGSGSGPGRDQDRACAREDRPPPPEASEPEPEPEKPTSEQRYAEAYAEGQREAVPGSVYRPPAEPWQRAAINEFTITDGWGKGLRGAELLAAIRQLSRDYRRAMNDDAFHAKQGYPPKLALKWAEGAEWKPRRPRTAPTRPVEARSPPETGPSAILDPKAAQEAAMAAQRAIDGIGRGAA